MSQLEKAKARIKECPKDYTYDEACSLMNKLGFEENTKGRTSGSRVSFYRESDKKMIMLHRPHPKSIMKLYAVKELKQFLENIGEL